MNAMLNGKMTWYAARASGLVAWVLVTTSVLWGLALSTRLIRRRGAPAWLLDLHKFLGTLSVVFVGVHVLALWADSYVHFGPSELFVPMASGWRPGAVAWGIVATYLLVAIELTSWAIRKLPRRLWRAVHLASFPLFAAATIHGFTAGADNTNLLVQWAALTGGLLVVFFGAVRVRRVSTATKSPRVEPLRRPASSSRTPPAERSSRAEPAGRT